eukprot:m.151125 g.151125  ORF g.151125 m.151125 type:complete len:121 (-) comp16192_c0_seq2:1510-1872(-)
MFHLDTTDSPGPAAHDASSYTKTSIVRSAPAFSLAGRPKVARSDDLPGPGQHALVSPEKLSNKRAAPAFSMGVKTMEKTATLGPGPAAVTISHLDSISTVPSVYLWRLLHLHILRSRHHL